MKKEFIITAHGHPNIKSSHKSTLEITKDDYLTPKGNCIIGINADYSVKDLPEELKEFIRSGKKVHFRIIVGKNEIKGYFYGNQKLSLTHNTDIVIRKSDYICSRTLGIHSSIVAKDLPQIMKKELKKPETIVKLILEYTV